jgi:hypothetical protein
MATCDICGKQINFKTIDGQVIPMHNCTGHWPSKRDSLFKSNERIIQEKQRRAKKLIRSRTTPNANCPECGAKVFYYENEHGSRVFFDELGPPWPKHPCTDTSLNSSEANRKRPKSKGKKWHRFFLESITSTNIERNFMIVWSGIEIGGGKEAYISLELFSNNDEDLKGKIIENSCHIRYKGDKIYELAFLYKQDLSFRAKQGSIEATTDKDRISKNPNKKRAKEEYFKRVRKRSNPALDEIKDVTEFTTIEPINDPVYCNLCPSYFGSEEELRRHLEEHWTESQENNIFSRLSKEQWVKLMIKEALKK